MSAWSWPPPDAVPLVVTAVCADGTNLRRSCDLRAGREKAETIELPDGTKVKIERPLRERVDLSRLRTSRTTPRAARPSWRDDSSLILWWRAWLAEREARRTLRSMRRHGQGRGRGGAAT